MGLGERSSPLSSAGLASLWLGLIAVVVHLSVLSTRDELYAPRVRLPQGVVQGSIEAQGSLESFRGIRYAHPPVGPRRFRRPQPVWEQPIRDPDFADVNVVDPDGILANRTDADGVFDATFWGPSCPQFVPPPLMGGWTPPLPEGRSQPTVSEDCLSVNVVRPTRAPSHALSEKGLLPVLVFFHGGAWLMGADFPYEPTTLASQGVRDSRPFLVVTFNYRLGAFGFLAGPNLAELAKEGQVDLNMGLHDQRTALRWVKRNIAYFGGNPDQITIAGSSAGGQSVSYQLLADQGDRSKEDLFHAAIMSSGGNGVGMVSPDNRRHRTIYNNFITATPCGQMAGIHNQLECLRKMPSAVLQAANIRTMQYVLGIHSAASWTQPKFFPFWPTIDGEIISASPYQLWREGRYKDVPMMMGNVLDEGTAFAPQDLNDETTTQEWMSRAVISAEGLTRRQQQAVVAKISQAYPDDPSVGSPFRPTQAGKSPHDRLIGGPESQNQYKRAAAALGDAVFQAPRRYQLRQHSSHVLQGVKKSRAWSFLISEAKPGNPVWGVPHGTDNDYLFRPMAQYLFFKPPVDFRIPGSRWKDVSDRLASAVVSFVHTFNPNHSKGRRPERRLPVWPPYTVVGMARYKGVAVPPHATMQIEAYNYSVIPDEFREEAMHVLVGDEEVRRALAY